MSHQGSEFYFYMTPVYISAGRDDRIATVEQQYNVAGSAKRTGFQRMKIGTFSRWPRSQRCSDFYCSAVVPGSEIGSPLERIP